LVCVKNGVPRKNLKRRTAKKKKENQEPSGTSQKRKLARSRRYKRRTESKKRGEKSQGRVNGKNEEVERRKSI